jgi:hypothetical protein
VGEIISKCKVYIENRNKRKPVHLIVEGEVMEQLVPAHLIAFGYSGAAFHDILILKVNLYYHCVFNLVCTPVIFTLKFWTRLQ